MQIVSFCEACYAGTSLDVSAGPTEVLCRKCGRRRDVRLSPSIVEKNVVDRCALCGCGHLYIEKDFNGYVGAAIIATAIAASAVLWARNIFWSIGVLAAAALVDLAVWTLSRERTVCYRCVAQYRGAGPNPEHERYELGTAGRFTDDYDEERRRHQG
jgi:hypothetical protein